MGLEVSVLVPDRIFLKKKVTEVILPTLTGQMGILKNHVPVLSGLDTGVLSVRKNPDSSWDSLVVMGGFALVKENKVIVLVNEAELLENIDRQNVELLFKEAKSHLNKSLEGKQKIEAVTQFKKAKARLQVINISSRS